MAKTNWLGRWTAMTLITYGSFAALIGGGVATIALSTGGPPVIFLVAIVIFLVGQVCMMIAVIAFGVRIGTNTVERRRELIK